jgi:hypothetical protein
MAGSEGDGNQKQQDRHNVDAPMLGGINLVLDVDHIANMAGDVTGVILSTTARRTDSAHNDR